MAAGGGDTKVCFWSNFVTMEMLPLNSLRALAVVVREGGVRPAARALGISHSAVGRHLGELERWLGVQVMARESGKRELGVTLHGRQLAEAMDTAVDSIKNVVATIREKRSPFSVAISTTPSFAARWLLPRLPLLERAHPRLEVSVIVDQRLEDANHFPSDFAIRSGAGAWPSFDVQPFMDDVLVPVMSPRFWETSGKPRDVAALRGLRLLHDRDPRASWQRWRERHGPADLDVRSGPRFASADLVVRAAAQGMGVALAYARLVSDDVAAGSLVRPFGSLDVPLGVTYWIAVPKHASMRSATKTVITWLREAA
jgi:LysR family glycine cleavage system transcriptional activator